MIESPASWCLGVALGLIINAGGFIPPNTNGSGALALFSNSLVDGTAVQHFPWAASWLYLLFVVACVSIMLSTVDSLLSAVAYTAYQDLSPSGHMKKLGYAKLITVLLAFIGLITYTVLRASFESSLGSLLYAAYSAQLSLFVIAVLALFGKNLDKRAAFCSLVGGLLLTVIAGVFTLRSANPDVSVLPPIFAVLGSVAGYGIGFSRKKVTVPPA